MVNKLYVVVDSEHRMNEMGFNEGGCSVWSTYEEALMAAKKEHGFEDWGNTIPNLYYDYQIFIVETIGYSLNQREVYYPKDDVLHRKLNSTEELEFIEWANDNYQANQPIDRDLWHPVIVQRCDEINDLHYTRRNQEVIDRALSQIFTDVINRDLTAIEEMLAFVPKKNLLAYIDAETAADHLVRVSNPLGVQS